MNRKVRRIMEKQGQINEDGSLATRRPAAPAVRPPEQRQPFGQRVVEFFQGVREELRLVKWAKRREVASYTTIVTSSLVVMIFAIYLLNYLFAKGVALLLGR